MANTIGTAYINIAPQMSGIQGKIAGGLKGSGEAFSNQFSGEVNGKSAVLIGAIAGVASAAMNSAIGIISNSLKGFVDGASQIQSLRASFESLTGDVGKTNDVMKTLYDFSQNTAFSNQDIQSAGRSFLAVGQNVDQMKESMQLAGDIAGATGANLGQLILPLSQAYSRGTLQTQDFYQILGSGAGALRGTLQEVVAHKTGITNLGDAMQQGKVSTDLLWEAMRQADQQGGFAFQGAIKQAQTFGGRMSNLQDGITQVGLKILGVNSVTGEVQAGGLFDKMSNGVQWLTENLPKIQPALTSIGNVANQVLTAMVNAIPPIVQHIKDVVDFCIRWKDVLVPIAVGVLAIASALAVMKAVNAVATIASDFGNVVSVARLGAGALAQYETSTKLAAAAQAVLNAVMTANPIGIIIMAIVGLVAGLAFFFTQTEVGKKAWASFMSFLGTLWEGIKTGFAAMGNFFTSVWAKINSDLSAVGKFFGDVWGGVMGVLGTVGNFFKGIFDSISNAVGSFLQFFSEHWRIIIAIVLGPLGLLIDFVTAYWSEITGAISTAVNFIWGIITTVFSSIANFFSAVWSTITGIISGAANYVWNIITTVFTAIAGFFSAIWGAYVAIITAEVNFIWGIVTGVFNAVAGFMGAVFGPPINAIVNTFRWLAGTIGGILGGIWNGITGTFNSVIGFFGGVGGRIGSMFAGAGGWLYNSGRDIINGLIHGSTSLLSNIGNTFLNIIPDWIKEPFKKALGIHSPSRVFAGFGVNTIDGYVNAVTDGKGKVTDAIGGMADAAVAGMTSSPLTANVNGALNVQGSAFAPGNGAGTGNSTTQHVSIDHITLSNADAAKEFFRQLNYDTINVGMGLTPVQGAK